MSYASPFNELRLTPIFKKFLCFFQAFDVFKNFYLAKHSGRILTLQPGAGTADLNAVFYGGKLSEEDDKEEAGAAGGGARGGHKKHILNVNTYQMVVLLMFNTRERLTYEEIKEVSSWALQWYSGFLDRICI